MGKRDRSVTKKSGAPQKHIVPVCLLCAVLLLFAWVLWGNTALMVTEIRISSDRLPASFSGFRIAHISDLHNASFGENNAALLQRLSDIAPDMIAITGDLIDKHRTDVQTALRFAREAVNIAPVYGVTGNHEAWSAQVGDLKAGLLDAGVVVLEDETVQLARGGETILLAGLNDPDFTSKGNRLFEVPEMDDGRLRNMLGEETGFSILLSHRPELFETYAACGVDLVLSGHAHGGQFRLPFIGGLIAPNQGFFPRYDAGLFVDGQTHMVVSRGLGNSVIPLRFNNRPEIVLIELFRSE